MDFSRLQRGKARLDESQVFSGFQSYADSRPVAAVVICVQHSGDGRTNVELTRRILFELTESDHLRLHFGSLDLFSFQPHSLLRLRRKSQHDFSIFMLDLDG